MVHRYYTEDDKNRTKSADSVGNKFPSAQNTATEISLTHIGSLPPELSRLKTILSTACTDQPVLDHLPRPLELEELEMLEAELSNQGILTRSLLTSCSVTQHAHHESNVWRWRAQRSSGYCPVLHFQVDVPRYLLSRAESIREALREHTSSQNSRSNPPLLRGSNPWLPNFQSHAVLEDELLYLERFAAYLCGVFDETSNLYQRGLNVVLRVLSRAKERQTHEQLPGKAPRSELLTISLPISKEEFFVKLKAFRESIP